ncbi:response regulator transcription factor [Petroclostridium sp. X23]|uniref:response regulator n=1 Tax=Petroclostridium sp. X23 TaxID=3045146 RepID=UPI0024AE2034|nr:response regulator transcription factor [Petroclostridium sp. X23]WHH59116.1 response regulator transcription factor [Petroclostridium sp. X23]
MNKIKILIADDHLMVRQGLKQIVELENDIEVVAQASNGEEAVKLAMEIKPDVILMDINMPNLNGIQAIAQLKEKGCPSRIIMLTIHAEREYLIKTVQLGAAGYVLKDADSDVLIEAIQSVYKGQSYIQPNLTTDLIKEFTQGTIDEQRSRGENQLTQREIEVLELIAEGMLNKEIAAKLYISEKTVKNHVSNIFKKLNVSDRTQAAIYAFKNNIKKD